MLQSLIINQFGNKYKIRSKDMWYQCPFHNGKSYTSFSVNINTGLYHCFKCNAKGKVRSNNNNFIKKVEYVAPVVKKELSYKPTPNQLGKDKFKQYIKNRGINIDVDSFNSFNFNYNNQQIGLIIDEDSVYNYYLDENNKIKKIDGKSLKLWSKGSECQPFYFKHQTHTSCKNLYISEGLEDILAFINVYEDILDFTTSDFCCLFGIYNLNPNNFSYLNINQCKDIVVNFCVDNDEAAKKRINEFTDEVDVNYVDQTSILQDYNVKDFNELLLVINNENN
jgi:hypothetical protein